MLSRARRVVEIAFGILGMRFQCLLDCMKQTPATVDSIIMACVKLHKLLRNRIPVSPRQAIVAPKMAGTIFSLGSGVRVDS